MNIKTLVLVLLLLPSGAWAQGVPALKERQDLLDFYRQSAIQNLASMQELEIFRDGTVLHGFLKISGTSTNTHSDLVALAQNITSTVRGFFAIPSDYTWVLDQGGLTERPAVSMVAGDRKMVKFILTVDGVPLEKTFVNIMVDMEGHLRSITISVPRLRPEIVAAVRGTTITPFAAAAAIRLNANQLPADNPFDIKPNTDLKYIDLKKMARAEAPFIVYKCFVESARYVVDAKTGAIVSRMSMTTP